MSEHRENFVFYASWLDIIEQNYKDDADTQRELIYNIVLYGIRGKENDKIEKMFMQQAFAQIDSAKDKHNRRVEAGRKGGQRGKGVSRNVGNSNAKKKNNSKTIPNDNENDNENVNVNVNNIDNLHCQLGDRQKRLSRFADPVDEGIKSADIQHGHYEMRNGERFWVVDAQ